MSFITAEGVSFSWGQARILQEVSLCAGKGKFVGVIGPNGSGKSTLLKCIYRVLHQDAGCIFLDGKENTKMGYKETARFLGVVAQHNIYDFDFSVRDIVLMGRSPHKKTMEQDNAEDRRIAREALARVGLSGFEERTFAELSGGEQQRVILARALAQQTRALILDEPTNHLDVKYQLQLLNTVKSLDLTVVAAFHDLNLAGLYCDEIYVLKDGRLRGTDTGSRVARISLDGELYEEIDLNAVALPYDIRIETELGYNIVHVEHGAISVTEADCPDQVCVRQGKISGSLIPIACLPHRLIIEIVGDWE